MRVCALSHRPSAAGRSRLTARLGMPWHPPDCGADRPGRRVQVAQAGGNRVAAVVSDPVYFGRTAERRQARRASANGCARVNLQYKPVLTKTDRLVCAGATATCLLHRRDPETQVSRMGRDVESAR